MSRSSKKGAYVEKSLYEKVVKMNAADRKTSIKT